MTGNYIGSSNVILFGLSFYSLTLAYKSYTEGITVKDIFIASNPLLLFTGPIAIFFKDITVISLKRRLKYFLPYIIIGIFFYQIIAYPITKFFILFENTNTLVVLIYGIIFEVFIYFNFAGLSLILYGIFGIMGISIPLNFRQPFSSRNLIEFWRGWHVSLSTVLKELYYIPIKKKFNSTIAIICIFIFSGLWHGVTLNFIIWASFHASCFIITKMLLKNGYKSITTIIMIFAIPIGRIFFSDSNIKSLLLKLSFNDFNFDYLLFRNIGLHHYLSLFLGLFIIFLEFFFAKSANFKQGNYKFLRTPVIQFILFILILSLISESEEINFAAYGQR
jgi:D-alanyl-lipoteichoic acid acyltransferase DltB (MBOAT superfamily)